MRKRLYKYFSIWKTKLKKYQYLRCTLWILILIIVTLMLSLAIESNPWSSIISNIFAGLLTGLIVTLIGSIKGKDLKDSKLEKQFLHILHERYLSSNQAFITYRKSKHEDNETYFDATYDLVCEMHTMDEYILHADGDDIMHKFFGKEASEYFKEAMDYDLEKQKCLYDDVMNMLTAHMEFDEDLRKEIDEIIKVLSRDRRTLNRNIHNRILDLERDEKEIERSVP